ncbi:MAG: hypothetical protein AAF845_15280 [Bacteroidota bacterium]
MRARLCILLLGAALAGAGCEAEAPEAASPAAAPAVTLDTEAGPVHLADLVGRPVVVQLAPSDDVGAWAALADALADLEASGAVVVAVETDGPDAAVAEAFGYDGTPLAVVVDGTGAVRGRTTPTSGDALFEMAGPVLAEADRAETASWRGADSVVALVEAGGLVVSLDPEAEIAEPDVTLRLDAETFAADDLPADLGTPLAFVGAGAEAACAAAASWGYATLFVVDEAGALTPVEAAHPPSAPRPRGVRG